MLIWIYAIVSDKKLANGELRRAWGDEYYILELLVTGVELTYKYLLVAKFETRPYHPDKVRMCVSRYY